ncbi:MAG TPA: DotU family type IV/VI secretion system protein [Stellaceae bacterium]|nr:DotU family type IV/VI secretion system protein [Stellaceae bacterium]
MNEIVLQQRPFFSPQAGEDAEASPLAQFRQFYRELMRVKYALHAGLKNLAGGEAEERQQDPVVLVHHHLKAYLERLYVGATRSGGVLSPEVYRETQYLMAALADEVLLYMTEWAGRAHWTEHLIEVALFETRIAGERVFDYIDALIQRGTAANADLAAVYLVALSLGFRGKYRAIQDQTALRQYRRALRQIVERHAPLRLQSELPVFADAYAHTLDEPRPVKLPHLRPWLIALAAALAVYLVAQQIVWTNGTSDVEAVLNTPVLQQEQR